MKNTKPIKTTKTELPISGKLPRHQPRKQTYFVNRHGGVRDKRPPIDKVLAKLPDAKTIGPNQWKANCPCPDCHDTGQHLNVYLITAGKGQKLNDGDVVVRCYHAGQEGGCTVAEILDAMGLEIRDLYAQDADADKEPAARKPVAVHREAPIHRTLGKTAPPPTGKLRTAADAKRDFATMATRFRAAMSVAKLYDLAEELNVSAASLRCLHVGLMSFGYTFPEFNGAGEVVGIGIRKFNGEKLMMPGSGRGIYIPRGWYTRSDPILLVEGASDTAAATMLGFAALGRSDCSSGAKLLAEAILTGADGYDPDGVQPERVVVLGENDAKPDGRWPGKTGAIKVANELAWHLGRPVHWALPEKAKDLRAWVTALKEKERRHVQG